MRQLFRRTALSLVLTFATVSAIACGASSSEAQSSHEYDARGVVRGIDLGNRSITIQHEDVPNYMPAMTMPFELTSAAQATGLAVGSAVTFRFRPEADGRHVIVSIAARH